MTTRDSKNNIDIADEMIGLATRYKVSMNPTAQETAHELRALAERSDDPISLAVILADQAADLRVVIRNMQAG